MGKSSSQTIGYWYHPAFHMGLGYGPGDALLEIRGGDKTAWSGELTASGTITINKPGLFGGEKDQGGIQGDMDVMFGEATQTPNAYLTSTFGSQQPAWRGLMTVVFKGGRYGAMNPYPQKISYKWRKITKGWDGDPGDGSACWYAAKAAVAVTGSSLLPADASGWEYQVLPEQSDPGNTNLDVPTTGWSEDGQAPFGSGPSLPSPVNTSWPGHTVLWIRRTVAIAGTGPQTLTIAAENGCVVFINGALAGAINRVNADIPFNDQNIVAIPLNAGQTYTIAVKAFDEIPVYDNNRTFLTIEISAPGLLAMNPAHILYYARTQQHMGREPVANMNDASFRAAADWYYAQGFGLCTTYDASQESIDAFIARIEKVAGCSMTRSPADGLWYLDIANGEYDIGSLPILTDDDILAFTMQPATLDSAINSVSVQYFDPQQKTTVATRPVEALALVSAYGRSHQDTSYPEIPTSGLALRVAQRDLQSTATPTHGFEITATRVAHAWRKGTYFKLQAPKHGIADMVCIVGDPDSGTLASGAIKFTAVEDIYSLPASSFAEQETGVDTRPPQIPVAIMQQAVFEAPYASIVPRLSHADLAALPDDVGYLMTVAQTPGDYRDYTITVSTDGGSTYTSEGNASWAPCAQVIEGDALTDAAPATSLTLANGSLLASVVVGSAALWNGEICRVDAIDANATPPTLTLGRGCADTVPVAHAANSTIFFYGAAVGIDTVEYTDGETIDVELLTNSGSQQLDPGLATPLALTFTQRQFRPYPPAGVTVNDAPYPSNVDAPVVVAFKTRNRVTQADQLIDTTAADIAAEAGTTYTLRGYIDTSLDATVSGQAGSPITWNPSVSGNARIELVAVRDGVESNPVVCEFTVVGGDDWKPSLLFGSGVDGAWFDASDLSSMFQDTAGTVAVTAAGQTVALWKDKSGNAHHASQATAANRPTLQQDSSGNYYLAFDGTRYLDCGTAFNGTQFAAAVAFQGASANTRIIDSRGTGAFTTTGLPGLIMKVANPSGTDGWSVADASAHSIASSHTLSFGVNHVGYFEFNTATQIRYQIDGAAMQTVAGGPLGSIASTVVSRIGAASNDATQGLTGRIYQIAVVKRVLTTTEINKLRAYVASKSGLAGYGANYGNFYGGLY